MEWRSGSRAGTFWQSPRIDDGSARSVFNMATLEQRQDCRKFLVVRVADTPVDQEAWNAELRTMDYSHIPPLLCLAIHQTGRPRPRS